MIVVWLPVNRMCVDQTRKMVNFDNTDPKV
jgi:hypothetical protein